MATFSKQVLSSSTNGKAIKVTSNSSGTADSIHTAVSVAGDMDEIWLYAVNTSATSVKLTLCWGGTALVDDTIEFTVPAENGLYLMAPGLLLQNGLVVKAFAATPDVVCIHGFVNRIAA